jgi:exo-beta-1,3-glucanase (GH17 family)
MRILLRLLILAAAALVTYGLWSWPNRPFELDPLPGGKLPSVSFAPFRADQSPLTEDFATREQIEEDLRLLSTEVRGIRTYTAREGLEEVPAIARELGLKVLHSAWIDTDPEINEAEVEALIETANAYPDVIDRVIVGNEVLLRKSRTPEQLIAYIDRVKAAVSQPVGYADVWEFWLRNPQVADHVDFIVIHILPYWEDVPVSVDHARERILEAYAEIRDRFPGKPILIGEIGWPTAGRTRGPAETGLVDKARFINMVVRLADEQGFDYNLIEAFDQPWKSINEGTVGANWGLFSAERERKFLLTGPVVADPYWRLHAAWAIAIGLAASTAAFLRRRSLGLLGAAATAAAAFGLSSGFVWAVHVAATQTYYPFETLRAWVLVGLHAAAAAAMVAAVARTLSAGPDPAGAVLGRIGNWAAALMTVGALLQTLLLVVDGRYRDFLVPDYAGPVVVLLVLGLLRAVKGMRGAEAAAVLRLPEHPERPGGTDLAAGLLLAAGAVGIVAVEGPVNREAVTWGVLMLGLAIPHAASGLLRRRAALERAGGATRRPA